MGTTHKKKTTFPVKLWQLLNDSRLESAVRWSDDGQSFFVFESQLRNLCLGKENKIFFTREPKSFIRQLHLYGFRKLTKTQFKHPSFSRDKPHLIEDIKRSYRSTNTEQATSAEKKPPTKLMIAYLERDNNSNNDNSNDTSNNWDDSFDSYSNYNYDYSYYTSPTDENITDLDNAINQQLTSSSISSLCVCPGCCTL